MSAASRSHHLSVVLVAALVAVMLGGCADTLQNRPLRDRDLAFAAVNTDFPIYWVGRAFEGYTVTSVTKDNGGAYSVAYGDCAIGGQGVCVTPLQIVSSPDNSFLPGGDERRAVVVRGRRAQISPDGRIVAIATGRVVVDVFGQTAAITAAATRSLITINLPGRPGGALPPSIGNTGFARTPLTTGFTPPYTTPFAAGVSGDVNVAPAKP